MVVILEADESLPPGSTWDDWLRELLHCVGRDDLCVSCFNLPMIKLVAIPKGMLDR